MIESFKHVLVLAPHTDDGELGAGGTLSRLINKGVNVYYVAFSTAEESVPEGLPRDILKTEVRAATRKLGIPKNNLYILDFKVRKLNYVRQEVLEQMIKLRTEIDIDLVLIPSLNDVHQDHKTIAEEAVRAFKGKTVLGYELIWNNLDFNTCCFVKLDRKDIDNKIKALAEYKSQSFRNYMSAHFIKSLAHTRGVQIGCEYAEAFEVIRWVLN